MKALARRRFLKVAFATATAAAVPMRCPAPATLMEAGAGLCVVLTITGAVVVCVCRLCRPKYVLYFSVNEDKKTNGGREYICLSCSRAEAEQKELTKCQGPKPDLASCQALAAQANTNWTAVACGPIATQPALRAAVTLETTSTPLISSSWRPAGDAQAMDLSEDDPQVKFTVPRQPGNMFFRANAVPIP